MLLPNLIVLGREYVKSRDFKKIPLLGSSLSFKQCLGTVPFCLVTVPVPGSNKTFPVPAPVPTLKF